MNGELELYECEGLLTHEQPQGSSELQKKWVRKLVTLERNIIWIYPLVSTTFFQESSNKTPETEEVFTFDLSSESASSGRHKMTGSSSSQPHSANMQSFIQKKIQPNVRRSKSTKIGNGKENRPLDKNAFYAPARNASEPELPFFMPAIEDADCLDLSSEHYDQSTTVRSLHRSILKKDYCFEVLTATQTRCFKCGSAGERERWIEKIKRAINPNLDNIRRTEHKLSLYVQEAKCLPSKKKYFSEVCLDRKLCARTTSKWKNDSSIMWGEGFEFSSQPIHDDITVHLFKDSDKKKKKDKDYVGLVNLSVDKLLHTHKYVEAWYPLSTHNGNNKNKHGEQMAIRLKARFLSIDVLPSEHYKQLAEYLNCNYLHVCRTIGGVLNASQKDELAKIMVKIMYATGNIKAYMVDLVMDETEKVTEESLVFRENTIGTKSVEAFIRLVGMRYLHQTFGDFINTLFTMTEDCECDGSRLPPTADLEINRKNLTMCCSIAFEKIKNSTSYFPVELREVFSIWKQRLANEDPDNDKSRISFRLVTASLFLRLLCPAILNPILFDLAHEIPDAKTTRTLTLVAKVVQNLANRTRFGSKEDYMSHMDEFIRKNWDAMTAFVDDISSSTFTSFDRGFEGYIDLGNEFARLHQFFKELFQSPAFNKDILGKLEPLPSILNDISELLTTDAGKKSDKIGQDVSSKSSMSQKDDKPHISSLLDDVPQSSATEKILHPAFSSQQLDPSMNDHHPAESFADLKQITNAGSLAQGGGSQYSLISGKGNSNSNNCTNTGSTNKSNLSLHQTTNDQQQATITSKSSNDDVIDNVFHPSPRKEDIEALKKKRMHLAFKNHMFVNGGNLNNQGQISKSCNNNNVRNIPQKAQVPVSQPIYQNLRLVQKSQANTQKQSNQGLSSQVKPLSFANPLPMMQQQQKFKPAKPQRTVKTSSQENSSLDSRVNSSNNSNSKNNSAGRKIQKPKTNDQFANYDDDEEDCYQAIAIEQPPVQISNAHLKTGLSSSFAKGRPTTNSQQNYRHKKSTPEEASGPYPIMSLNANANGEPVLEVTSPISNGKHHNSNFKHPFNHQSKLPTPSKRENRNFKPETITEVKHHEESMLQKDNSANNMNRVSSNVASSHAVRSKNSNRNKDHRSHHALNKHQSSSKNHHVYHQIQPIQNSTRKPVVSRQMSSGKSVISQSTEDRTAQWVANIPSDFPINNEQSRGSSRHLGSQSSQPKTKQIVKIMYQLDVKQKELNKKERELQEKDFERSKLMEENEMLRVKLKHSESVIERLSSQLETSGVKRSFDSSRQNGIHFIDGEAPNGSRINARRVQSPQEDDLLDHSSADESDGQSSMRTENGARTASNKFAAKS